MAKSTPVPMPPGQLKPDIKRAQPKTVPTECPHLKSKIRMRSRDARSSADSSISASRRGPRAPVLTAAGKTDQQRIARGQPVPSE